MIFGIFHLFFVHLYILLVGRPQHYGPVFNHNISKLVLLEISVWVLGTLHGVYKARRSAPEPSQEGGWCGEEKVRTLGKQGGGSVFRGCDTDLRRWVWFIVNLWMWNQWDALGWGFFYLGPLEFSKNSSEFATLVHVNLEGYFPPMPTHQWLITSSYGLVSWRGGIGRGTLWFAWWLPWIQFSWSVPSLRQPPCFQTNHDSSCPIVSQSHMLQSFPFISPILPRPRLRRSVKRRKKRHKVARKSGWWHAQIHLLFVFVVND